MSAEKLTSYEVVTIDNWDIKLSRFEDQILVAIQNRDSGITDVRFFTNELMCFQWIDYVTQIQVP